MVGPFLPHAYRLLRVSSYHRDSAPSGCQLVPPTCPVSLRQRRCRSCPGFQHVTLMHLSRAFTRIACLQSFVFFSAIYAPGRLNCAADACLALIYRSCVVWLLTSIPNLNVYRNLFSACWFFSDCLVLLPFDARTLAFYASCVYNKQLIYYARGRLPVNNWLLRIIHQALATRSFDNSMF